MSTDSIVTEYIKGFAIEHYANPETGERMGCSVIIHFKNGHITISTHRDDTASSDEEDAAAMRTAKNVVLSHVQFHKFESELQKV